MKLLDKSGSEVAELIMGDARVVNWGKSMSLIYHGEFETNEKTGEVTSKEFTVRKVSSLNGFAIETDGGKKINLTGDEQSIIDTLLSVGVTTGFKSFGVGVELSAEAVKRFKDEDEDDVDNINIHFIYHIPVKGDYPYDKNLRYPRSVNAVTYEDLIKQVSGFNIDGYTATGLKVVDNNGPRDLLPNGKIASDCEVQVVWTSDPYIVIDRLNYKDEQLKNLIAEVSTGGVSVRVPLNATVKDFINLVKNNKGISEYTTDSDTSILVDVVFSPSNGPEVSLSTILDKKASILADGIVYYKFWRQA